MKTTIYVFSGTGTSLAIAQQIGAKLGDTTLISIASLQAQDTIISDANRIGFVFPCYYGGLPTIVRDFVKKLVLTNPSYLFAIITAGGHPGYGFKFIRELLAEKGLHLDYCNAISVSSNYMAGWYYNLIRPKDLSLSIEKAKKKTDHIAAAISDNATYLEKDNFLAYRMPHLISPKRYVEDTRPWDKEFLVASSCTHCGICEKVCPVNNITHSKESPKFNHNCQRCMACVQYCPKQAIIIDGVPMNKPTYVHPDITIGALVSFNHG